MKTLTYLLVILGFTLFWGCKSSEMEYVKFRPYKARDYILKNLEIYRVSERLYPILDSIIIKTEECPMYQGRKQEKIAFSFTVYPPDGEVSDTTLMSPYLQMLICAVYIPKFWNHALWTSAIFYYKDYEFYFDGAFFDTLLKKTNEFVSIRCIDPKKYQSDCHFRGDIDMCWWYELRNDSIINSSYGVCTDGISLIMYHEEN